MRVFIIGSLSVLSLGALVVFGSIMGSVVQSDAGFRGRGCSAVPADALQSRSPAGLGGVPNASMAGDDATAGQSGWRHVTFWAGRGSKDTPPFIVTSPDWRVTWSTKNVSAAGAGSLEISVYDDRRELVARVTNTEGPGAEYIPAVPGRYRIRVDSAGLDWDVAVEEQR
jgi:hypothetical protein